MNYSARTPFIIVGVLTLPTPLIQFLRTVIGRCPVVTCRLSVSFMLADGMPYKLKGLHLGQKRLPSQTLDSAMDVYFNAFIRESTGLSAFGSASTFPPAAFTVSGGYGY